MQTLTLNSRHIETLTEHAITRTLPKTQQTHPGGVKADRSALPIMVQLVGNVWEARHGLKFHKKLATAPRNKVFSPHLKGGFYDMGILDARNALCAQFPELWEVGFQVITNQGVRAV